VPEDLLRSWIGYADQSVTGGYSRVKEDIAFLRTRAENLGLGLELPTAIREQIPEVVSICTQSESVSLVA
jgi:hypothetical protein